VIFPDHVLEVGLVEGRVRCRNGWRSRRQKISIARPSRLGDEAENHRVLGGVK
jgi:hypothetical protein